MTEREYWIQLRAALLKQVRALELQRDGLLQQVAVIERQFDIGSRMEAVNILPSDTIAGILSKTQEKGA